MQEVYCISRGKGGRRPSEQHRGQRGLRETKGDKGRRRVCPLESVQTSLSSHSALVPLLILRLFFLVLFLFSPPSRLQLNETCTRSHSDHSHLDSPPFPLSPSFPSLLLASTCYSEQLQRLQSWPTTRLVLFLSLSLSPFSLSLTPSRVSRVTVPNDCVRQQTLNLSLLIHLCLLVSRRSCP